ncbi:helix-turn-helix transcriptional regulator [Mycobacteroides franklinii]|uniref:Helix-turn-helix domain protein n=1 Tax=Mycobacteroides franklinii TaxID=948102 RepID=A0A4R8R9L9_9MYCO|nr:helix-turn-helix domain-containing protein [Mycobacteroides franklinii]TDZ42813.1 Helix-turn-helix domain protein [Mycobacteroides franklinii]TDZ52962.1 Helix-turn-helix domain protein [Mycobacteroides franklinii]TDZ56368.1 Helix-turn-helix domain protein [Mycobacteroides franklinii]TDZ63309.1 Helix-turn-helix domain protein [Mycobacteroides franklinii]TDZ69706.1 Helix-turn-helix domain protein [Mycobacteroides franklinii]
MTQFSPNSPTPTDTLLTVPQALEALKISRTHFYRLRGEGKIKTLQLGARTLVPQREISRLINEALGEAS